MRWKSFGVALSLAFTAAPATAERIELREKDLTAIEPAMAYVLLATEGPGALQIFRRADSVELAAWEAKRAVALQKAERRRESELKHYKSQLKLYNDKEINPLTRMPYPRPAPVEQGFYYKPPELSNFINILGQRYIKDQDYILLKLKPGDYVLYTVPGEGKGVQQQGQCLCMGSVGFTAEAGRIVSVGRLSGMANRGEFRIVPAVSSDLAPASLKQFGVTPARLWAVGKIPNFNGSIVARVGAVPGVLSYARDLPLDAAGQPALGVR